MQNKGLADLANYSSNQGHKEGHSIKTHPRFPWLDPRGFPLSDEDLKVVSSFWNNKTWERYLSSLDGSQTQSLIEPWRYDQLAKEMEHSIFDDGTISDAQIELGKLFAALEELTEQQRKVIQMFYFDEKSEREISRALRIDKAAVHRHKTRALKKIKELIEEVSDLHL